MPVIPEFTVLFDLDSDSPNYKNFVFTLTNDFAGLGIADSDVFAYWDITFPDGTLRVSSFTSPDINGASPFVFVLPLPVDASGEIQNGIYSVQCHLRITGNVQPGDTSSQVFSLSTIPLFSDIPVHGRLTIDVDCFEGVVKIKDNTPFGSWSASSYELTVFPPPSTGAAPHISPVSQTTYTIQYTGGHEININALLGYESGVFSFVYRFRYSIYEEIRCDLNLCSLYGCIEAFFNKIKLYGSTNLGKVNVPVQMYDDYLSVIENWIRFQNAVRCNRNDDAKEAYVTIKNIVSRHGCSCGCPDNDTPQPFIPPINVVNNQIYIVQGQGIIEVTSSITGNVTTYVVKITQGAMSLFNNMSNAIATHTSQIASINTSISSMQGTINNLAENQLAQIVAKANKIDVQGGNLYQNVLTYNNSPSEPDGTVWEIYGLFEVTNLPSNVRFRILVNNTTISEFDYLPVKNYGNRIIVTSRIYKFTNIGVLFKSTIKYGTAIPGHDYHTVYEIAQENLEAQVPDLNINNFDIVLQASNNVSNQLYLLYGTIIKYKYLLP